MSKLENCTSCETPISTNAETCPKCGEPLGPGWAKPIIEARELREEDIERGRRLMVERQAEQKRKKKKHKRIFWGSATALIALMFYGAGADDRALEALKTDNPVEYARIISDKIATLEKEVAIVPASDHSGNIVLYEKLLALDPENQRYVAKIRTYETAQKNARAASVAKEKAEERRTGAHCTRGYGATQKFRAYVKASMRDPSSFDHISTSMSNINANGNYKIYLRYRAKNGFGGTNTGTAKATVRASDCSITVTSIK